MTLVSPSSIKGCRAGQKEVDLTKSGPRAADKTEGHPIAGAARAESESEQSGGEHGHMERQVPTASIGS